MSSVSVEVRKSQHKYVVGPRGGCLQVTKSNSRMAQTTQWLQAIQNCMKKVRLRYQPCIEQENWPYTVDIETEPSEK